MQCDMSVQTEVTLQNIGSRVQSRTTNGSGLGRSGPVCLRRERNPKWFLWTVCSSASWLRLFWKCSRDVRERGRLRPRHLPDHLHDWLEASRVAGETLCLVVFHLQTLLQTNQSVNVRLGMPILFYQLIFSSVCDQYWQQFNANWPERWDLKVFVSVRPNQRRAARPRRRSGIYQRSADQPAGRTTADALQTVNHFI